MKRAKKILLFVGLGVVALAVICVAVFAGIYASRLRTIASIEKIIDRDGELGMYDVYRMDVKFNYDLDAIIDYGINNDQDFADAMLKEMLPLLPVKFEVPKFGCSAFTVQADDGTVMMGRNYDFRQNTSAMLVYCAPKDGYRSVAFSALSNIKANEADSGIKAQMACLLAPMTCLDGMNEKGVSIAVLTLDSEPTRQDTEKSNICTTLAIRLVLDRAATTEEAVALLSQYDMLATSGRDYHFYITDASGDGRVVEWDCDSSSRQMVVTPTRTTTNFFIMYKDKVTDLEGKNNGYGHGLDRYLAIEAVFDAAQTMNADVGWQALKAAAQEPDEKVATSNTQWSILFNNSDLTLEFAFRRNWEQILNYDLKTNTVQLP